jgi:hypothetical protein
MEFSRDHPVTVYPREKLMYFVLPEWRGVLSSESVA